MPGSHFAGAAMAATGSQDSPFASSRKKKRKGRRRGKKKPAGKRGPSNAFLDVVGTK